jgi:hypothetical protein
MEGRCQGLLLFERLAGVADSVAGLARDFIQLTAHVEI